jgi:hypothetical protein
MKPVFTPFCFGIGLILLAAVRVPASSEPETGPQPRAIDDAVVPGVKPMTLAGHQRRIAGVVFTLDGKELISAGEDGTLRFWNPVTGQELRKINDPWGTIEALAISPDGKTLAVVGGRQPIQRNDKQADVRVRRLRFLNLPDGREIRSVDLANETVLSLFFTADGSEVVTVTAKQIQFHDAKQSHWRSPGPDFGSRLAAAAISPGNKYLAISTTGHCPGDPARLVYLNPETGESLGETKSPHLSFPAIAFAPNGKYIALGIDDSRRVMGHMINLCEPVSNTCIRMLAARRDDLLGRLAFSQDGRLVAGVWSSDVTLYEAATGQARFQIAGHTGPITALAIAGNARLLATGGDDGLVNIWDVTGRQVNGKLPPVDLSNEELASLWQDLAELDGRKAYQAIWHLVAAGNRPLPFLRDKLIHLPGDIAKRVDLLVSQLDDPLFRVRERAGRELEQIGAAALGALELAARNGASFDMRLRAQRLLTQIPPGDDPGTSFSARQVVRSIEVLEHTDTPEAIELLEELARRSSDRGLHVEAVAALQRLRRASTR